MEVMVNMKKIFLSISGLMFLIAFVFVLYVFQHPTGVWPFDLKIAYLLYKSYLIVMVGSFILGLIIKRKNNPRENDKIRKILLSFSGLMFIIAIVFLTYVFLHPTFAWLIDFKIIYTKRLILN